ncbi:hypothetical protein RFM99_20890 [Mesorhizobium sp. VK4C]|uniref:hypothetical protein n=1 Tax=Mesorhizobium captivum TaxID=3072319 RepID=UPI002A24DAEA|nr:hypothetical protein [Mesorhizobium sp. VK4C]MDX8500857.1 hypothetical protein [Mesorhizobium sp. VK4C]
MKRDEKLAADEFLTAARKSQPAPMRSLENIGPDASVRLESNPAADDDALETRTDARKALRRLKQERMKGVQNFVNVHLDRETKKRLKLASFASETSMQFLVETAIRKFLDDNGF